MLPAPRIHVSVCMYTYVHETTPQAYRYTKKNYVHSELRGRGIFVSDMQRFEGIQRRIGACAYLSLLDGKLRHTMCVYVNPVTEHAKDAKPRLPHAFPRLHAYEALSNLLAAESIICHEAGVFTHHSSFGLALHWFSPSLRCTIRWSWRRDRDPQGICFLHAVLLPSGLKLVR